MKVARFEGEIRTLPLDQIIPYEFNNKNHNNKQVSLLASMIEEAGFTDEVLIDKNNILIAGHGRLETLKKMGYDAVDCKVMDMDLKKIKKFRLLHNKVAELAENNLPNIEIELQELDDLELNELYSDILKVTTSEEDEKEQMEDSVPEAPEEIIVQKGDIFQLGEHLLMCGDSADKKDVDLLMAGMKADMIFTDPPYNVAYKGSGKKTKQGIMNDDMTPEMFEGLLNEWMKRYRENVKTGAGIYVFHSLKSQALFEKALRANGFNVKTQLIWNKPSAGLGMNEYRPKHEPFFYCTIEGEDAQFYGDRTHTTVIDLFKQKTDKQILKLIQDAREQESKGMTTIWTMKRENVANYVHPTQKPIELIEYALENSSKKGDLILDLFGGSGSTLIACEKKQRQCYLMELDPHFVQTIITRYDMYSKGKQEIRCVSRELDIKPLLFKPKKDA